MKRVPIALLLVAALSCKKDFVQNTNSAALAATSAADQSLARNRNQNSGLHHNTKFGCLIAGDFTSDQRVSEAQSLNVGYVRDNIILTMWNGKSSQYEAYVNSGMKVLLNLCYDQPGRIPEPFPTDMVAYKSMVTDVLDKYSPEVVVCENEEINKAYYTGSMLNYINMLKVVLSVAHSKGLKVANGGIYGPSLEVLVYRYLQTKGQARADSFGNNCMMPYQVKAAQNPNSNPTLEADVRKVDTLLYYYTNMDLDYVNVHLYEPFSETISNPSKVSSATPGVVQNIQEYIAWRTGKKTITNETGQRDNSNPDLVTSMLTVFDNLNFPYTIWYSGEGVAGCKSLYNLTTGKLYSNGQAFASFMAAY